MTYRFDMQKEVDRFAEDFPQFRKSCYFVSYDSLSDQPDTQTFTASKFAGNLAKNMSSVINKSTQKTGSHAKMIDITIFNSSRGIFIDKNDAADASYSKDQNIELAFTFDHELGHMIGKRGYSEFYNRNEDIKIECESVADAFAVLRGFQRYGAEKAREYAENLIASRSTHLFTRDDVGHTTAAVIEKILEDSEVIDFTSLSPKQLLKACAYYGNKEASKAADIHNVLNKAMSAREKLELSSGTTLGYSQAVHSSLSKIYEPLAKAVVTAQENKESSFSALEDKMKSVFLEMRKAMKEQTNAELAEQRREKLLKELREEKSFILAPVQKIGQWVHKVEDGIKNMLHREKKSSLQKPKM